ncbi:MAG: 2-C-methyl-D-erythritol 2,4-cyclodiphosphate synthase [Clostridiales bacterium]|nr:2-C-methyl-D-erythritol 2,4-cyclodiphosphate synthase [Clostridiales bacterium]
MYKNLKVTVVIPAAGSGTRMKNNMNKLLIEIDQESIMEKTLNAFENHKLIDAVILVTKNNDIVKIGKTFSKVKKIVSGGESRQDSVSSGIDSIEETEGIVLIHDAARPFVTEELINRVIEKTFLKKACIPAVRMKDTVKRIDGEVVAETLVRDELISVQTPQGFLLSIMKKAVFQKDILRVTDDSSLVEALGIPVYVVEGDYENIKITTVEDLARSKELKGMNQMKIGIGYDVHKLVEERELILGGVKIDYERGLLGHSDADVLLHAIMDAILGAIGKGDIGKVFPDTDDSYKGISSLILLEKVKKIIENEGYNISNIDAVVIAQKPKIAPYVPEMIKNIARVLSIDESLVNIKGTTTEKLGFEGRGEGISSQAIVMVDKK